MLSQLRRLRRPDFILVRRFGHTLSSSDFSLVFCRSSGENFSRVAVVVSAKISKSAVTRNRLRRQIYDHFLKFTSPVDLIIYPKTSVLHLSHAQIDSALDTLVSKISVS